MKTQSEGSLVLNSINYNKIEIVRNEGVEPYLTVEFNLTNTLTKNNKILVYLPGYKGNSLTELHNVDTIPKYQSTDESNEIINVSYINSKSSSWDFDSKTLKLILNEDLPVDNIKIIIPLKDNNIVEKEVSSENNIKYVQKNTN